MTYHPRALRPAPTGAAGIGVCAALATALFWTPAALADSAPHAVADLVARVSPSVVTVMATQAAQADAADRQPGRSPFPPGSPFEEFFRQFGAPGAPPPQESAPAHALGSGFVIGDDGYIVTNNHVVDHASKVRVRLTDKREFDARVIGVDDQTDIALLKVEANDLPALTLGDSDAMRVGEDVVAVGNPFGLGGTVTRGIVSAKGRDIQAGPYVDFIQTDAAINHGNSGGPLFNLDGEVIGVNAAIYSPSGGSVGVGFAIPSNTVRYVVKQLRDEGEVRRGWLGVSIQNVTPEIALAVGMDEPRGALVAQVIDGAPADGKLRAGDVITAFNGEAVAESHDLPRLVAAAPAETTVPVEVLREGKPQTVDVRIGALETGRRADAGAAAPAGGAVSDRLGASFARLTPEIRERLGLPETGEGAVVSDLKADGPAAEAGLRVGDVVIRVGDEAVTSPEALTEAVGRVRTGAALLLVQREGGRVFVGVPLHA